MLKRFDQFVAWWCYRWHSGEYWAVNGEARCKVCMRARKVAW
jgi:hypothetical protein